MRHLLHVTNTKQEILQRTQPQIDILKMPLYVLYIIHKIWFSYKPPRIVRSEVQKCFSYSISKYSCWQVAVTYESGIWPHSLNVGGGSLREHSNYLRDFLRHTLV